MKLLLSSLLILLFTLGCSHKAETHKHSHTSKLQKKISIKFKSIDTLSFTLNEKYKNPSLKVFLVDHLKSKKLLLSTSAPSMNTRLNLPEDIDSYNYIVAIVEASDATGKIISSTTNYKVGEQEDINAAKERLKNRD